jgi:hypothetical protein
MGMFDEIIIPKSYLKGVLDKKDEELFDTYHQFQTKDLENSLAVYKIYRNRLYKRVHSEWTAHPSEDKQVDPDEAKPTWDKATPPSEINFYDTFCTKNGDECWFEFEFKFVNGKLDSKKLTDKTVTSKESQEATERMWDAEQEVFDKYRKKWSYRFWTKVERFCQKLTVMARNRHLIPYDIRKRAYKTSGRLEKESDCLKWYMDI